MASVDAEMDVGDHGGGSEVEKAVEGLLFMQQNSKIRSRQNSTSSLDSDPAANKVPPSTRSKISLDPKNSNQKPAKYGNFDKGNCPVFIQRDPSSTDANKDLNHISIGKTLHALYPGKVVSIHPSGRGKVRVVMNSGRAANQIVSDPTLKSKGLVALIPNSFVTCQGIINNIGLDISNEEILENAEVLGQIGKDCKIINVMRFNRKVVNEAKVVSHEPSTTVLLTFQGTTLPERVAIFKGSSPVRPYVPDPRMCLKCFRFGHIAKNCRSKARCQQCGSTTPHDDSNKCPQTSDSPTCLHCKGPHRTSSKLCPKFVEQKEIRYYATMHRLSFSEARQFLSLKTTSNLSSSFNFSEFPDLGDCPTPSSVQPTKTQSQSRSYSQTAQQQNFTHPSSTNKTHKHKNMTKPLRSSASSFFASNWDNGRSKSCFQTVLLSQTSHKHLYLYHLLHLLTTPLYQT
ncbi:uncharacterized protein LOC122504614 [Leptopilina heterotoma]|uniref:uncharacterized protein LOC122504614 n=1 Tax=Leptopilina heterotoma TaxID=63436 RepID=UPI001CA85BE7|nr:uncharacterized protein LOC122504614 [Leptopilina heterotoma]